MKRISIIFSTFYLWVAVLQLSPAFGTFQKNPLHNTSKTSFPVSRTQRLSFQENLPPKVQMKLARHMKQADYDIYEGVKELPPGQDRFYSAFNPDQNMDSFPVAIDPVFSQVNKLVRIEHCWSGEFGASVAISGDIIVVGGTVYYKTENSTSCGAVYIFYRDWGGNDNWGLVKKIIPSDGEAGDDFGYSVSISGDRILVGAPGCMQCAGDYPGKAYIFERNNGGSDNWGLVKKFVPIDGGSDDDFGYSVSLSGDTAVVSSYHSSHIRIFYRNEGEIDNWGQSKDIAMTIFSYGYSVSINGDTLVIGSTNDNENGTSSGAAHVFYRDQGGPDSWGEAKKIIASDGVANDRFGSSVCIDGDSVVVGASGKDSWTGAAYVFERHSGGTDNWGESKKIIASDGVADDQFGASVCINGDTVLAGAFRKNTWTGAAYVFERHSGGADNWGETRKITANDGDTGDSFGNSLCISGDIVVVGAHTDDFIGYSNGSAYIFDRNYNTPNNWGQVKNIVPIDINYVAGDRFGTSVSIDSFSWDTLLVGAYYDDQKGSNAGAVYAFERNFAAPNNWRQYRKIFAISDGAGGDYFGHSVSVSYGIAAVGAYGDDDNGSSSGSVYIFDRNKLGTDGWGYDLVKKITPIDGAASDYFGWSVAIFGDTLVVGAYGDDDLGSTSGSVYIFERNEGGPDNWGQVKKLTAFDGAAGDEFGRSVSIFLDTIVVGAPKDDDLGSSSGSVYIIDRWNQWGLQKKINTADVGASDYFGWSVSAFMSNVLVGAYGDDDNGSGSGAAYLFSRDTGGTDNWGQVKKFIASDGASGDAFGHAVSISFNTAVVGAYYDDDNGLNSGSAYTFSQDEGGTNNWGEVNKITANDGNANDLFGDAVAVLGGGDTVVVGANQHDEYGSDSGAAYIFSAAPSDQPDLVVLSVVTNTTSPEPGEPVNISVTIKNQGTGDAGPFVIDWYADLSSPPTVSQNGDAFESVSSLAAGAIHVMNAMHTYAATGNYSMYTQVDTQNQVTESQENNNVLGPVFLVVGVCEGDFNNDGDVDGSDLATFAADFGRTNCDNEPPCEGNFDNDNDVDGSDLATFAADFGRTDCP